MTFIVIDDPPASALAALADTDPANPFASGRFAASQRSLGSRLVLFAEQTARGIEAGAIGCMKSHKLGYTLEIPSAPCPPDPVTFWNGVRDYCKRHRVVEVEVDSYGVASTVLPTWESRRAFRERTEWIVTLNTVDGPTFSSNHRRSINRARNAGVNVIAEMKGDALEKHIQLMSASIKRRAARGESVPQIGVGDTRYCSALLESGSGCIYQAYQDAEVLSSLFVLKTNVGAYYQSAGTSPEGMELGASNFLISTVINLLAAEGKISFNLGGAGPEAEGLRRFKAGFGAIPRRLEAGVYNVASPVQKVLMAAARTLRSR